MSPSIVRAGDAYTEAPWATDHWTVPSGRTAYTFDWAEFVGFSSPK
jgi:hypothetical protein